MAQAISQAPDLNPTKNSSNHHDPSQLRWDSNNCLQVLGCTTTLVMSLLVGNKDKCENDKYLKVQSYITKEMITAVNFHYITVNIQRTNV